MSTDLDPSPRSPRSPGRNHPSLSRPPWLLQAVVKTVDMEEAMEKDAIELATFALNEYTVESQMANHIKREFDKKYRYVTSRWAWQ